MSPPRHGRKTTVRRRGAPRASRAGAGAKRRLAPRRRTVVFRPCRGGDSSIPRFHTTRWSLVVASNHADGSTARKALDELCAAYWYPLYAFLRSSGLDDDQARDEVQAFVTDLLERGAIGSPDRERGPFRAYLVGALKNHVANSRRAENAQKRGGGAVTSLDLAAEAHGAAARYDGERGAADRTPADRFEHAWAHEVLERARARLEAEWHERGRGAAYDALADTLDGSDGTRSHAERAEELGCSEGAVKVAAHRLRQRMGELIRDEVAQTVAGTEDVEAELQALFAALGGTG